MTTLWDTTGSAVVKALSAERRSAGAVASGLALTVVVVVDESGVGAAEAAATTAASQHPCRLLIVVRRQPESPTPRLDAEVVIGGRLGPTEAVVMRMYGRLALHAESVALPLLAPDTPVLTWWYGEPPHLIANDPLGVFADRRVTDVTMAADPLAALAQRAEDYVSGDTDLSWTRTTPWRGLLASAFDGATGRALTGWVAAERGNPSARLLAGWLQIRLGVDIEVRDSRGPGITEVHVDLEGGDYSPVNSNGDGSGQEAADGPSRGELHVTRTDARTAVLRRSGEPERAVPLFRRDVGELLAEELRRLDADQPYADALGAATGHSGLADRVDPRTHIWTDPAQAAAAS